MDTNENKPEIMSTKPLQTAFLYDFYMFLQLVALLVLCASVGKIAFFIDRRKPQGRLTLSLIHSLEWIANLSVLRK